MSNSDIGGAVLWILFCLLILASMVGYVFHIIWSITIAFNTDIVTTAMALRAILGIFLWPVGAFNGWYVLLS
jgi:uncharacterized membrane protein